MSVKQKVILLILVVLSVVQQGVRWTVNNLNQGDIVTVVQAAESICDEQNEQTEKTKKHCALVHINTAGMAELQTLPGIGPIYAERIIEARREKPFLEKRDLLRVSGIGEKRLAQIAPLICLYYDAYDETK